MSTIAAPTTARVFQKSTPINSSGNDLLTDQGVRISSPIYVDLPINLRKDLFNGVRTACTQAVSRQASASVSGITVEEPSRDHGDIEGFIGMNLDVLRNVIFSRGGLPVDLVLRLQAVTGLEYVTAKNFADSLKKRTTVIKDYITNNTFQSQN